MTNYMNLKILLVDDNQFILNTLFELLDSANYKHVDRAKSAEEALVIMSGRKFDLIITDVEMGEMNGLEFLKMIRTGKAGADKKTPVIVLTSHSDVNVLGTAIALDANGFLAKPVRIASLIGKIQDAVQTELNLRPAVAYGVISSDILVKEAEPIKEEVKDDNEKAASLNGFIKSSPNEVKRVVTKTVLLDNLETGMVLANDIVAESGSTLIKSGTSLTANSISRLKELSDILSSGEIDIAEEA